MGKLPPEFITKIWVCDDQEHELALGTDAGGLREKLAQYQEKRFARKAARSFSATPMTRWDCGDLPASIEVGSGTGYPALREDADRVKLHVFPSAEEAALHHRRAVRRLALIRHGDFLNSIRKKIPIKSMEARLALTTVGQAPKNNLHDTIYAAMDAALANPLPRTAAEFDAACLRMRESVYDRIAGPLGKLWEQLAATDTAVRSYCLTAGRDRFGAQIAEDVQREWAWLTRPWFLSAAEPAMLADYSRFLRGLQERIKRIAQQPAARELERIASLNAAVAPRFFAEYDRHADSPAWLVYGFMVAEFRLSLFAPALAAKGRASAKKLEAAEDLL
jgi:ATP-dependent helicase HrpA